MARTENDPEFRKLQDAALAQGWGLEKTKKGYWQFKPPEKDKEIVVHAGSPSDHRAIANTTARLRRSGLNIRR